MREKMLKFSEINSNVLELVGGKAFNLAYMYQKGITVPKGFVILASAYDEYIKNNEIEDKIQTILTETQDIKEASKQIKQLFNMEMIEDSLINDLYQTIDEVGMESFAVRSSSTAEDLEDMSFAGQYTTYLNVSKKDVLDKIICCWKSLWNERAISYRKKYNIDLKLSQSVIIQEMVDAEVAGVIFTANPITGVRNEAILNASYGLGEAIVSGEVHPDQFTIDKITKEILKKELGNKKKAIVYAEEGVKHIDISEAKANRESLKKDEISKLVDQAINIETIFGRPQDIEFAFDKNGDIYILQSRDITTLYPIEELEHDNKLRGYLSAGTVLLGMKEPFTPMGFDIMSNMFPTIINVMTEQKEPLNNSFVKYAGNRIYVDMTYLLASKMISKQFANAFSGNDLPFKDVMEQVIDDYNSIFTKQGIKFRLPLGVMKYGVKMGKKTLKITKIPNEKRYDAMIEQGDLLYEKIYDEYKSLSTIEERLVFSKECLVEAFKLSQFQAMYCLDVNNFTKIEKTLRKYFGNKYTPEILVQSLPRCFTQTMTIKLNEYAKTLAATNSQPSIEDKAFQDILKQYGHRANIELDLGTKRWREDPTYLLELVATYLKEGMYKKNLEEYESNKKQAKDMIEAIYEEMKVLKGERKAKKLKEQMINYRIAAGMREYPKSDIVRFLELGRLALQNIGSELQTNGVILEGEDVFFLHQQDIRDYLAESITEEQIKQKVEINKEEYTREIQRKRIPRILLNNGATYYNSTKVEEGASTIQGMSLSPGMYEGKVRIVYDPMNTELQKGEILVTESTNPAWTPLFATAGALIMEYGGPMSHGGIVAREYGIPAVVGISAKQLKDGQSVRVNGESGTVELLN